MILMICEVTFMAVMMNGYATSADDMYHEMWYVS